MSYLQAQIASLMRSAVIQAQEEPYYEVLESISFNGTQMFWLPVKPALDVKIDITFKSDNYASTSCLFGGRINASGSNRKMFAFWQCVGGSSARPDDGYMRADLANYSTGSADIGKANSTSVWTNVVKDGKYNYLDGVLKATQSVSDEFYDDTNTYIALGCMSNGTESSYNLSNPFSGDVAQLKIWKAGTQVADYVPVLDNKMQPCLYNRITKEFLYAKVYPSGSTTTYDLGFKRWNKFDVDYIASDGNQYIDTGYKFTNTSAFEITCAEVADFESSTVLCGARDNTDTTTNARIVDYNYSAPSVLRGEFLLLQRGGYDVNENVIYIPYDKEFHTYYQSPTRMSIDDTDRPTVPSLVSPNMSFYIFWQNVGTATAPAKAKIKVKNCKLWDNGTLVRDYKPVVWHNGDATAEACLYDEVYNKMYQNAGTGSFKAYIEDIQVPYTLAMHDSMDITIGSGAYISATGVVTTDGTSCYTKAIPVKEGDVITLTVTGKATTAPYNKRIHGYTSDDGAIPTGSTGSWVQQLDFINFPAGQTGYTTQQITVTVPSGINYIRLSHCVASSTLQTAIETQCDITLTRTYEVGKSVSGNPSSSVSGVSNCFDTGLYGTQNTSVKYMAIGYDSQSTSGQLFGSYDGTTSTSNNLTINSTGTGNTAPIRFDGQAITTPIKITLNEFASIVNNRYGLWVNETLHGSWGNVNDFTTLTTMLILKCNNSTNTRNNGCCYCAIYESDKLIAEYIPVRNANNSTEFGLYDKVDKSLNTGVGTLNFNELD